MKGFLEGVEWVVSRAMFRFRKWAFTSILIFIISLGAAASTNESGTEDFVVYSVFQTVSLGAPSEVSRKDYYVSMGYMHGVRKGSTLEVMRRVPTFDLANEKLYREMIFPIARIKVIHVETKTAIARLEELLSADEVPTTTPNGIVVGDTVRLSTP